MAGSSRFPRNFVLPVLVAISLVLTTSIPIGYPGTILGRYLYVSHFVALIAALTAWCACFRRYSPPASKNWGNSWFIVLGLAFSVWLLFASVFSPLMQGRAASIAMLVRTVFLPILVAFTFVEAFGGSHARPFAYFRRILIVTAQLLFPFGLAEVLLPWATRNFFLSEVKWEDALRSYQFFEPASAFFEHYNVFGAVQAFAFATVFPAFLRKFKCRGRSGVFAWRETRLIITFTAGVLLSTSKAAIISLVVCAAWNLRAWNAKRLMKVASAFALLFLLVPGNRNRLITAVAPLFTDLPATGFWDRILQGRTGIYASMMRIIRHHPWNGMGFFQTSQALNSGLYGDARVIHPHNLILWLLVDGGIPALALFAFLSFIPYGLPHRSGARWRILVTLQILFFLVQVTDIFLNHIFWPSIYYYLLVAIMWNECLPQDRINRSC